MWKIKYSLQKQLIKKKLTDSELLVLLYLALHQSESGWARGIYYQDVCEATGLSIQSYYNACNGLSKKEIIQVDKWNHYDRDILIKDNDFRDKDFSCGYFDLSHTIFQDPEFYQMKCPEMLIIMDLLKNCSSGKRAFLIRKEIFFQKYKELFDVTERTLRGYLKSIQKFFNIRIHNGVMSIIAKAKKVYRKKSSTIGSGETRAYRTHVVRTACNREKIKEYSEQDIKDTIELLNQYRKRGSEDELAIKLGNAIRKSVLRINEGVKKRSDWSRRLDIKLVHTLFRAELNV